ncbi:hypothetical protein ACWDRX_36050, partial [Streptomyces nigra]
MRHRIDGCVSAFLVAERDALMFADSLADGTRDGWNPSVWLRVEDGAAGTAGSRGRTEIV